MQNYVLPPPPARVAAPVLPFRDITPELENVLTLVAKPQPRAALQDASDRINTASPVKLAPMNLQGKPFTEEDFSKFCEETSAAEDKAQARLEAAYNRLTATSKQSKAAAPAKPTSTASKKRKSGPETSLAEDITAYKQDLSHIEVDGLYVDMGCAAVRTRINQVLDGGIMKKGEFCSAIGSSNRSLNTFLQKRGSDGSNTESYTNAWAWFKQRELAGLKLPDVKKRQKAEAAAAAAATGSDASGAGPAAKKSKTAAASDTLPDLTQIHLEGEETDSVPVFDSADELRKKISAHLKTPGLTQAQFCRDLFAQLHVPTCKSIQSKQLSDFRGKKGPIEGCASAVFYTAYVYFEKMRLAKGKPKSNHRTEMERVYDGEGMPRDRDGRTRWVRSPQNFNRIVFTNSLFRFWVGPGERITMDPYGQVHIS